MLRNVTTVVAALLIAVAPTARAQSSRPQFEVASIKANAHSGFSPTTLQMAGSRFSATGMPLRPLILIALLIFIGQNSKSVTVHFLGANGHVPLAVALLLSAVAGLYK